MNIVDLVRNWGKSAPRHSWPALPEIENSVSITAVPSDPLMRDAFGMTTISNLPAVTEYSALSLSAVYACVNLLAGVIASLPMHIYSVDKVGNRERLHDDPLWWMLNEEFSPRWLASAGWEWLMLSRLFYGDAFAEIQRNGSKIVGLRPVHPRFVEVAPWPDGSRLVYRIWPESWEKHREPLIVDQDDMIHIPGLGFNGIRSLSPLRYSLRMTGAVALATQDYSAQYFANSARPDYALSTEKTLTAQQIENITRQIEEKHSRAAGLSGKPMVLQGGLEIKTISIPNEDAELLATRRFQTEEICRVYGVPPFMVGSTEKTTSWGSGVSEMGAAFVRYSLRSHLTPIQNEFNRKFFRTSARVIEFDTFELERGDMKGMIDALRGAVGTAGAPGFMSQNEARARLFMNPKPGADDLFKGIKDANKTVEPAVA